MTGKCNNYLDITLAVSNCINWNATRRAIFLIYNFFSDNRVNKICEKSSFEVLDSLHFLILHWSSSSTPPLGLSMTAVAADNPIKRTQTKAVKANSVGGWKIRLTSSPKIKSLLNCCSGHEFKLQFGGKMIYLNCFNSEAQPVDLKQKKKNVSLIVLHFYKVG